VLAAGGVLGAAAAAFTAYRKPLNKPDPSKDVAVVSASLFSDKQLIMDLLAALRGVERTLECTNELLEADAQRRHDEAIVRKALAEHGLLKD
jgi:hypothetical protein